jgi:hypothetical protein
MSVPAQDTERIAGDVERAPHRPNPRRSAKGVGGSVAASVTGRGHPARTRTTVSDYGSRARLSLDYRAPGKDDAKCQDLVAESM